MDAPILFHSAHEALKFCYNFSSQQYDRPTMNKLADKGGRTGKGLAGNDGAGQAGMIRREVRELGEFYEAIVIASFAAPSTPCACRASCCSGHKANKEWSDAIYIITMAAMSQLSGKLSHYALRRGIVERQFGIKRTLSELAEACKVDRDTASHHNAILTSWLTGDKDRKRPNAKVGEIFRAISAAEGRLSQAGFIGVSE
jgi:hypothetical protein